MHAADLLLEDDPAGDREVLLEVADADERLAAVGSAPDGRRRRRSLDLRRSSVGCGAPPRSKSRSLLLERSGGTPPRWPAAGEQLGLGPVVAHGLEPVRAARVEGAARRDVDQRGRRALDRDAAAVPSGSTRGIDSSRPHVYGCSGRRSRSRRPSPCSTACPAYMTMTLSQRSATTPRSWVIRMTPMLNSFLSAVDQVEDLRLDRHVERGRRLVRDQDVRVVQERHRDHRALAHAARVLVRVVAEPLVRASGCRPREHLDGRVAAPPSSRRPRGPGRPRRSGRRPGRKGAATRTDPGRSSRSPCPRIFRSSSGGSSSRSLPWKSISPVTSAALRLMRPSAVRQVTLLPEPDSPDDAERLAAARP